MPEHYDVAIVGGGPGGSTTGTLLKKYRPETRVLILEREIFPREHVGESQLPQIGQILDEMGAWPAVEAADFPIKVGATYLWGRNPELWDFNFVDPTMFKNQLRPEPYRGIRKMTALQVERATYDDILLKHAAGMGCEVRQGTGVRKVHCDGDRVTGLELPSGETVTATYYIDASGNAAVVRRALGVEIDCPTKLKNVAAWDYWENATWADTIGVGGTRVQVISVGFGWIWFIPLGPTRTSIGLVCPVEYYKKSGKPLPQLYDEALAGAERIQSLIHGATRENQVRTTNDWSFVSQRTAGANWFLVGETAGFADPILAAGLTLTHVGGRECAYTLRALFDGTEDAAWLKHHYHDNQTRRVRQHMRFADFWYSANGQFTDLQDHCAEIARESGLTLDAKKAWQWLAQGGFTNDVLSHAAIGGCDLTAVKSITDLFTAEKVGWDANDRNVFRLNLAGATLADVPMYDAGHVRRIPCYLREGHRLPMTGVFELLVKAMQKYSDIQQLVQAMMQVIRQQIPAVEQQSVLGRSLAGLEMLVSEGWVTATLDPTKPRIQFSNLENSRIIRAHEAVTAG